MGRVPQEASRTPTPQSRMAECGVGVSGQFCSDFSFHSAVCKTAREGGKKKPQVLRFDTACADQHSAVSLPPIRWKSCLCRGARIGDILVQASFKLPRPWQRKAVDVIALLRLHQTFSCLPCPDTQVDARWEHECCPSGRGRSSIAPSIKMRVIVGGWTCFGTSLVAARKEKNSNVQYMTKAETCTMRQGTCE